MLPEPSEVVVAVEIRGRRHQMEREARERLGSQLQAGLLWAPSLICLCVYPSEGPMFFCKSDWIIL